MEGVTEEMADVIPDRFRNSIRWNLGHIYVVAERFAFQYIGLPQTMPDGFKEQFEFGTSPENAGDHATPSLAELEELLQAQSVRIRESLTGRLGENVSPYTTSAGMKLETPEQFLSFSLYHEGMHFNTIKFYKFGLI